MAYERDVYKEERGRKRWRLLTSDCIKTCGKEPEKKMHSEKTKRTEGRAIQKCPKCLKDRKKRQGMRRPAERAFRRTRRFSRKPFNRRKAAGMDSFSINEGSVCRYAFADILPPRFGTRSIGKEPEQTLETGMRRL
jgi:hypothetical protein